jgi:hypothetical protein
MTADEPGEQIVGLRREGHRSIPACQPLLSGVQLKRAEFKSFQGFAWVHNMQNNFILLEGLSLIPGSIIVT